MDRSPSRSVSWSIRLVCTYRTWVTRSVPSTVGATQNEAKAALDPLGLTFIVMEKRYSEDIPEGSIIESSPAAGKRVEQGGNINLIISKGP